MSIIDQIKANLPLSFYIDIQVHTSLMERQTVAVLTSVARSIMTGTLALLFTLKPTPSVVGVDGTMVNQGISLIL